MEFISNCITVERELKNLIGNEQKNQIDTLKTEIFELKMQLKGREDYIKKIEQDTTKEEMARVISKNVQRIIDTFEETEINNLNILREVVKTENIVERMNLFMKYIWNNLICPKETTLRLSSVIKDNAEFLIRVAQESDLRKAITNGDKNLIKKMFVKQAEKSMNAIRDLEIDEDCPYSNNRSLFSSNPSKDRTEAIRTILDKKYIDRDELISLYLQEVGYSCLLAEIAFTERRNNETLAKSYSNLKAHGLTSTGSPLYTKSKVLFNRLRDMLKLTGVKYTADNLLICMEEVLSKIEDCSRDMSLEVSEFWESLSGIIQRVEILETLNTKNRSLMTIQASALSKATSENGTGWLKWGKKIINNITDIRDLKECDMKAIIEDAAICGCRNKGFVRRVNQLRKKLNQC